MNVNDIAYISNIQYNHTLFARFSFSVDKIDESYAYPSYTRKKRTRFSDVIGLSFFQYAFVCRNVGVRECSQHVHTLQTACAS